MGEQLANIEEFIEIERSVEFDTHAELLAFVKGMRFGRDENIDVLTIGYYSTPHADKNGKFSISVSGEPRNSDATPPCV